MAPLLLFSAGCAQEIVAHQQVERDANHMLVLLQRAGIEPMKERDTSSRDLRFNILVPPSDATTALVVLERNNLPKTPRPDTAAMFSEGGMIPTTEQERAKRVVGIEGDIVNALRDLPQVVDVDAAVSIPEVDPLRDINEEAPKPKASVIIVWRPGKSSTPPFEASDVQKFVQAKLPELRLASVNVLLLPASDDHFGASGARNGSSGPPIDPSRGCLEKERVLSIDVCQGSRQKIFQVVLLAGIFAAILAALCVVAVLRAMRYRKDLTRLTAQFQKHGAK